MFARDFEFHPGEYSADRSSFLFKRKYKLCTSKDVHTPSLSSEHDKLIKQGFL